MLWEIDLRRVENVFVFPDHAVARMLEGIKICVH